MYGGDFSGVSESSQPISFSNKGSVTKDGTGVKRRMSIFG